MRILLYFLVIAFLGLLATLASAQSSGDLILQYKGSSGASLQYLTPSTGTGIPAFNGASPNRIELLPRSTFATPAQVAAGYQPLSNNLTTLAGVSSTTLGRNLLSSSNQSVAREYLGLGSGEDVAFGGLNITGSNAWPTFIVGCAFGSYSFDAEAITGNTLLGIPDDSGMLLTENSALNATNITSGSLALARLAQTSATTGQALVWNGTAYAPATVSAPVTSVAGRTGAVTLTTSDIGGLGTMATQAANSVAVTGGSITGVTELLSSDPDLGVDTHGNVNSKYWRIGNNVSNGVTLEMSVVSGAVPSTPGAFMSVASVSSGLVFISPGGHSIVLGGTTYLNNNFQSSLSSDGDRMLQLGNDSSTPGDAVFHGPNGSGTNITGGKTVVRGGNGTGTGGSGAWELQTSPVGSSGSTANTPRATLRGNKDGTIDSPTMPVEASSDTATHKLTFYVNGVRYKLLAIQE